MNEHNPAAPSLKTGEAAESAAPPSILRMAAMMLRRLNQGLDPMTHAGGLLEALCLKIGIQNAWLLDLRHAPPLCVARFPETQCSNLPQAPVFPDPEQRRSSGSQHVFALGSQGGPVFGQLLMEGTIPNEPSEELDLALATLESAFAWKKPEADDIGPLRRAFENSEDGFWEWDLPSGKVVFSDRDAEMLGYTQEEIPKRIEDCALLYHPEDFARGQQLLAQHAEGKIPLVDTRLRMRHKNGSWVWIRTRAKIVERDPKTGEPTRVVGADTDISEQKAMEEELQKLAVVVRSTSNAVVLRDRNFCVEWINDAFVRMTGYTLEEVRGRTGFLFLEDPKGDPHVAQRLNERLLKGERVAAELSLRTKQGERRWVSMEAGPIYGAKGDIVGFMNIGQDITERVLAEEEKSKMEERVMMSQRLESVGLLAGGIAHDFNNLLMGVLLEAGAAREELPEHSPVEESLAAIEASAKRMAELVNQLLAYAGRGRFVVEKVDPNALVKDTVSLIARNIDKQAELVAVIEEEKAVIEIDPSQLRQVVMNLVINASDALRGGQGRISVRTECAGGVWILTVEDSGQGMSEEVRSRVFDPFFTTKKRGRGLGLSTVHGVVKRGKGVIEVDSKLGVGSVFRVRLPLLAHAGKEKAEHQK